MHFVTADVGGSGVLESAQQRVLAKPQMDPSSVLASENSVFLEGQAITKQAGKSHTAVVSDLFVVKSWSPVLLIFPSEGHPRWRLCL